MGFFKALFSGKEETPEERRQENKDKDFDVLKYDGVRAMKTGQLDYGIKCFKHALSIHDDLEIHDHLSLVYIQKGALEKAIEELQLLSEAQPDNIHIWIRKANVAYMLEDYQTMYEAAERAIDLDNEEPLSVFLRARASKGLGDNVGAIAMLTKAISLDHNYGDAYLLRGEMLLDMGDKEGAKADVAWLLENIGDHEDVLLLDARIKQACGDIEGSLSQYQHVIDSNPFCVAAFRQRGALYREQGDMKKAAEDAAMVLELSPDDAAKVNGEFSSEGIEQKVRDAYKNANPLGL